MQIVTQILKIGWSWYNIHCGPKNPKLSELNGLPVSGNSPRHLNSNLSRQIPFGQWLEKSIAFKTVCATIGGGTWNHENSIMLCRPCGCGHVFFLNSQIYRSLSMVFWQLDELFFGFKFKYATDWSNYEWKSKLSDGTFGIWFRANSTKSLTSFSDLLWFWGQRNLLETRMTHIKSLIHLGSHSEFSGYFFWVMRRENFEEISFHRNYFVICIAVNFYRWKKKLLRASHWNVWSLIILCWRRLKPKYVAVIDRTRFARSSTYKRTNKWKKNRHTNDYS